MVCVLGIVVSNEYRVSQNNIPIDLYSPGELGKPRQTEMNAQ